MDKFKTVEEVVSWKPFSYKGTTYSLSHLDAHIAEFTDKQGKTYSYIVTYSFHCFAKDDQNISKEESELLLYVARKENRHFNFERYRLSKHLPKIIRSLGDDTTICFHAEHSKFARYQINDEEGNAIHYFVVFKSFKEKKKLRLHIESAYPVEPEKVGKYKKISFFTIAYNTLHGKPIKKPVP